jgi:hypothetical protein
MKDDKIDLYDIPKKKMFDRILQFKKERNVKNSSIMELVLVFCEEYDLDVEEVGYLLKEDKNFRETMKEDLKFNNEAYFQNEDKTSRMSEWI